MSFALGTSRNPAIIVARTPVSRPPWKSVAQVRAEEAAARSGRRQASYAANRLIAVPRGVPMYAVGRSQLARGEVKFFDVTVALATVGLPLPSLPPSGAEPASAFTGITELNCVQQGATSYNRIGTKILMKSIHFNCLLSMQGSAPTSNSCRLMLVYDRQPNGSFPALSAILSDNISSAPNFTCGVNMANRSRFLILRDQYYAFNLNGTTIQPVSMFVKTKLETQFSSNAGNIGDINTGALFFVAMAITNSAVCSLQAYHAHSRIRYFD